MALVTSLADKILSLLPEKNRPVLLWGLGGVVFVLACVTAVVLVLGMRSAGQERGRVKTAPDHAAALPMEEFFLPEEPNFAPEVLLERQPAQPWTAAEVLPFWEDPLERGEAAWRAELGIAVDRLLERVP